MLGLHNRFAKTNVVALYSIALASATEAQIAKSRPGDEAFGLESDKPTWGEASVRYESENNPESHKIKPRQLFVKSR